MEYNRAEPPPLQLLDSSSAISEGCPKSRVIVCLSHPSYVLCCLSVASVVLQGSLHVEEPQPGEAGRVLGRLGQARRLLTVLWNRGPHPHPPVHQPSVRDGFCHKAPQKKKESVCSFTFTFTFRAFSRHFYPKRLTMSPFVMRSETIYHRRLP